MEKTILGGFIIFIFLCARSVGIGRNSGPKNGFKIILFVDFYLYILISASRIRYEITRGNFGGAFAVKNMTGAIYVAGPLDYEQRKRVNIISAFIKKKL